MMRTILIAFMVFVVLSGCSTTPEVKKIDTSHIPVHTPPPPESPGSIWPGETSRNNFFQDLRARNVGDTLTVIISEKTSAIKEATTSTSRSSSNDIALKKFLGLPLNFGMRDFLGQGQPFSPEIQSDYESEFEGSGKTKRSGELSATITVRVVDVLPNGNLVVEGKKDTIVNNEHQYIILSGIVRPDDISEDNTVVSTYVADARIEYSGKGDIAMEQRPGWMRRVLNRVWPF